MFLNSPLCMERRIDTSNEVLDEALEFVVIKALNECMRNPTGLHIQMVQVAIQDHLRRATRPLVLDNIAQRQFDHLFHPFKSVDPNHSVHQIVTEMHLPQQAPSTEPLLAA